ncbi:amidophosphoribosyltransferase [Sulfitobacter sp. D35]|uniref:amidophosphoribosyltransferase n=1 Tax=Sulfitobacter sp. D35 TaxID=3083252 RepID=UPI00296E847C|nr:amidophosphoribosyltransferase [Sulfitobacter sp. D35]MDW4496855.1 amidophosphoribosyltransferase [Sulfitobacter sp. D35]
MASQTNSTVAKHATTSVRFENTTLIGVFGRPGAMGALLRLSNGRIARVETGDTVGGARVVAIAEDKIALRRGSRNTVLHLPDS